MLEDATELRLVDGLEAGEWSFFFVGVDAESGILDFLFVLVSCIFSETNRSIRFSVNFRGSYLLFSGYLNLLDTEKM